MNTVNEWHQRFLQQSRWTQWIRHTFREKLESINTPLKILEVGCGTGAVCKEYLGTSTSVYGLDLDMDFLKYAQTESTADHFIQGDGGSLPLKSDEFDLVYCHYFLLWVHDPEKILREMVRIAKPGGWVAAFAEPDYGGRVDYPEELVNLGKMQVDSLLEQSADPFIGRKVRSLFASAGIEDVQVGIMGYEQGNVENRHFESSEWTTLEFDLGKRLPINELNKIKQIYLDSGRNGTRIIFIPTFYTCGRKNKNI